jgi:hypothetical protein
MIAALALEVLQRLRRRHAVPAGWKTLQHDGVFLADDDGVVLARTLRVDPLPPQPLEGSLVGAFELVGLMGGLHQLGAVLETLVGVLSQGQQQQY